MSKYPNLTKRYVVFYPECRSYAGASNRDRVRLINAKFFIRFADADRRAKQRKGVVIPVEIDVSMKGVNAE